jgi:hypothetical protein
MFMHEVRGIDHPGKSSWMPSGRLVDLSRAFKLESTWRLTPFGKKTKERGREGELTKICV